MISTNQHLTSSTTNSFIGMNEAITLKKLITNQSIKIENLDVYIEDQHILKDINLTIPEKSITCIIGPSGCGKSTFLKTLNRMHDESPEVKISGKVFVDDENIYGPHVNVIDTRKKMGLLAQRPCPLPMSIFENVAYGPRIHGIKRRKAVNQTVIQYLQYVGLWDEVRDRIRTSATRLSIGQQQRLCLARGLAIEPEYILGDEATSALDPLSTKKIEELFVKLKEKYTIILVTHTLRQAKRIADHIIFMYMGKIIEAGPTEEFFNNPKKHLTKKKKIKKQKLRNLLSGHSIEDQIMKLQSLFPDKIIFTTSLGIEDQIITHKIFKNNLKIKIATLDTGRLFPQTYEVLSNTIIRYNKTIDVCFPEYEAVEKMMTEKGPFSFYKSVENRKECCKLRKVVLLNRALAGMKCWISGIRADQSDDRNQMDWLEYDEVKKLFKFYPLFNWSFNEVKNFIKENNVPYNSLHDKGYVSIGCEPCTRAVKPGENFRSGRWWWENDGPKECGLHIK